MKILRENQIKSDKWNILVKENLFKSPFQTELFFNLINNIPGMEAKVFAVEENESLVALCVITMQKESGLKSFFSRRAIIYGGPLFTENKEAAALLLKHVGESLEGTIYIETRNTNDYTEYKKVFEKANWQYMPYNNFHLECTSEEVVWNHLNNNRQRQIKKAEKLGVKIQEAKKQNEVIEFYAILKHLYMSKIRKPLFSYLFFEKLMVSEIGKILLVKIDNKIIGGIACAIMPDNTIYELYVCGLDKEYKDCSPSVMATFGAIEYGYKNGLKRFDFMGAGKPDENYGVRDFKEKFGGKLVEHGRFLKINNSFMFNLGKFGLKILSMRKSKQN